MLKLPDFSRLRVLVAGDVMLDRYLHGDAGRISPEAPVPVVSLQRTEERAGGAANVAMNLVALGCETLLAGVVGDDEAAQALSTIVQQAGVQPRWTVASGVRTTTKTRVVSRRQQLLRVDDEQSLPVNAALELIGSVRTLLTDVDLLILSDYDKGALADPSLLIDAARIATVPVVVDPKLKHPSAYAGASIVKPNLGEFWNSQGLEAGDDAAAASADGRANGDADHDAVLNERMVALRSEHHWQALVVTLGARGMKVVDEAGVFDVAAVPAEVFDVTGAGDTVAAVLGAAVAAGSSVRDAAMLANLAAARIVERSGTASLSADELLQAIVPVQSVRGSPITDPQALARQIQRSREKGERVVFTNGCFDLLHAGHVGYLQEAAALGDRLIVAINDDDSVARLKGPQRPVNRLHERATLLAALDCVDWVVSFAQDTPEALLEQLRPDVLVKGGDYSLDEVVGAALVKSWGGEVQVVSEIAAASTTERLAQLAGSDTS